MVYTFNPLEDPRWPEFVQSHPRASVFHTRGWLEALRRTYGYEPVVYTTTAPNTDLTNGIVCCVISSWLTGRRLVSLPFADHCQPLIERQEDEKEILSFLKAAAKKEGWRYVEIRSIFSDQQNETGFEESESFSFHVLDLRAPLEDLFRSLQKSSIQRKIKHAEAAAINYEKGTSERLLEEFYALFVMTRRRHRLPPQPVEWFRNLTTLLGKQLTIHVASRGTRPIASILTLRHSDTLVYKYGCSDARFHNLGAMPFLFWKAIQLGKGQGLQGFDLGRSDPENAGLLIFKDRLGARRSKLTYARFSPSLIRSASEGNSLQMAKRAFACMPDGLLTAVGRLLYRHIG